MKWPDHEEAQCKISTVCHCASQNVLQQWVMWQDFDKLEGILKDYKGFLEASDSIDMSLPLHAHLAGFDEEGLKIAVHVRTHPAH